MWRETAFKRQKIPDIDISGIVPIISIEPIVVPDRYKANEVNRDKEISIVDRFVVDTSELDEINEVINGH